MPQPPSPSRASRPLSRLVRSAVPSVLILAGAVSLGGCAGVDPFGPQPLAAAAQSAVHGRGTVVVRLEPDGTAVVDGWVEDRISERSVLSEVAAYPGVTGVVDRVRVEDFYR